MKLFKNVKQGLAAFALGSLALVACEPDPNQDYSPLVKTNPTVSNATNSYETTITEQDTTFVFAISATEAQIVDIPVNVVVNDMVGFDGEGYTFTDGVIAKGATSTAVAIEFEANEMPSTMQKLTVQVGDSRTSANSTFTPNTYTYTVLDYDAMLSWNNCDADFDLLILDEDDNDIGYYSAATGDCPELIDFSVLADGTYQLGASLFNPEDFSTGDEFPLTFAASNNSGESLNVIDYLFVSDGTDGIDVIGTLVISGSTYTIRDSEGTIIGTM